MKKLTILALPLIFILSTYTTAFAAGYTDVNAKNWAYNSISTMSEKGIIKGYPDGSFKPNETLTYGEFIKMTTVADLNKDVGVSETEKTHWAANYYNEALELNHFAKSQIREEWLDENITRRDMALIISSILGDVKIKNYDEIQKDISDIDFRTKYEYDITKAYAAGILTGYPNGTFRPENTLTRAEAAAVIERLIDDSKRQPVEGNEQEQKRYKTADLLDMDKLTPDRVITDVARFTDEYELYEDASKWNVRLNRAFDGEIGSFNHELRGFIYPVKDGVIIDACQTLPRYNADGDYLYYQGSIFHTDITKADYIIAVPSVGSPEDEIIKVVVNPFK